MKRETFLKGIICAAFVGFVFCFSVQTIRAQNVQPFVECWEAERASNGASTGYYIAYFGYINYGNTAYVPINTAGNVVSPNRQPPGEPEYFLPGINHRVFSVKNAFGTNATWRLTTYTATVSTQSAGTCDDQGTNVRLITYQGRLSDSGAAANGTYDLQFQLFNAPTGGAARTTPITLEDVSVANGVFTVQLDLGANSIDTTGNVVQQHLNPSILSAENGFFEIGVRPGNLTGNFTVLTTRQPLTAAPWAMRANTANNAIRAAFTDYAANGNNNFQVVGDAAIRFNSSRGTGGNFTVERDLTVGGTINGTATNAVNATNAANAGKLGGLDASQYAKTDASGNLTVSGTLSSGCRNSFTAIGGGRLCVSAMQPAATFYGASGATQTCINMNARVGTIADATLSLGQSGFDYFGGQTAGWLGDYAGDNLRPRWNGNAYGDFDGSTVNVYTGAANGTAPAFPFRCVY